MQWSGMDAPNSPNSCLYYCTFRFVDKAPQHRMTHCTEVRQAGQQASFDPTVLGTFSDQ